MAKAATGIPGLDEIRRVGLPAGPVTLIEGGPGAGKTLLGLQSLTLGAGQDGTPGIFVTFEESPDRIRANCAGFAWADHPAWHDARFSLDRLRLEAEIAGRLALMRRQLELKQAEAAVQHHAGDVLLNDAARARRELRARRMANTARDGTDE